MRESRGSFFPRRFDVRGIQTGQVFDQIVKLTRRTHHDRILASTYERRHRPFHGPHLPVAADGSCNGLQNFSALLRDKVGGKATNLLPTDIPEDIYSEVASVVTKKLKEKALDPEDTHAAEWLRIGVSRKITKKPVMTLPYGSTLSSCTESVEEWLMEHRAQHTWESLPLTKAAL
ncbi:MAG: DNA-directed RNA polymerase, partial [Armatimonadota bacterium]